MQAIAATDCGAAQFVAICLLIVVLGAAVAGADGRSASVRTMSLVEQKLTLVSRLIQRLPPHQAAPYEVELEALQTRFLEGQSTGLLGEADDLLVKVSHSYRNRSERQDRDQELYRVRYEKRDKEMQHFEESFLAILRERSLRVGEVFDETTYRGRLRAAQGLAANGQYPEAYAVLDGAYHQLVFALKRLRDQETVDYRLQFANAEEEYAYEQRRYRSQVMMLEMVLADMPPDGHTEVQVRQLMADAETRHQGGQDLARKAQFADALAQAEIAAGKLERAMRLTGYGL